jgi:hypothetical protein
MVAAEKGRIQIGKAKLGSKHRSGKGQWRGYENMSVHVLSTTFLASYRRSRVRALFRLVFCVCVFVLIPCGSDSSNMFVHHESVLLLQKIYLLTYRVSPSYGFESSCGAVAKVRRRR